MSTTVKVFIVLNLIMVLGFMFTIMPMYAWGENWKRRWDDDTRNLKAASESMAQLAADESKERVKAESLTTELQAKLTGAQAEVTKAQADTQARQADIDRLTGEVKKKTDQYQALDSNYQVAQKSLDVVRQRNSELNHIAQVARASAFTLNVKLSEVEDDLNRQVAEYTKTVEELTKTKDQLAKQSAIVALLRERHPNIWTDLVDQKAGSAFVSGVVSGVRPNPEGVQDLVAISIGADSKVEAGIELVVARGAMYICRVRVEKVQANMAACRVIPESWNAKKEPIQVGDTVQNRY